MPLKFWERFVLTAIVAVAGIKASGAGTITEYSREAPAGYQYRNDFFGNLPMDLYGPRIDWATPYSLGNLKILAILPSDSAREAAELKSRIPADISLITVSKYDCWHKEGGEPAYDPIPSEEMLDDLANHLLSGGYRYDAIIIGKVKWTAIPEMIRNKILGRVRSGAALLFISPWDVDEKLQKQMQFSVTGNPLADTVKQSIPLSLLPLDVDYEQSSPKSYIPRRIGPMEIRSGNLGGGTVVWLDYQDRWMKNKQDVMLARPWNSYANSVALTPFVPDDPLFYDYYYSILGKLLYKATGKTSNIRISAQTSVPTVGRKELPGKPIQFAVASSGAVVPDLSLACELRDRNGNLLKRFEEPLKLGKDETPVSPEIPALPRGTYIVDAWVLKRGAVLDWASAGLLVTDEQYVENIETSKKYYAKDEKIGGIIKWKQPLDSGLSAIVELWDTYGRLLNTVKVDSDGEFAFDAIKHPLSRTFRIATKVMEKDIIVDQQEKWVGLPSNRMDDYQFLMWGDAFNTRANKVRMHEWKQSGVTGYYDQVAWLLPETMAETADNLARNNLLANPYCIGPWGFLITDKPTHPSHGEMENILEHWGRTYEPFTEAYRRYGTMAYSVCEECFVARDDKAWDNPEVLRDYRLYLKERYGDIAKINEIWNAKFGGFDEINQISFADAKTSRQPTRWLDQELHKVDRFNKVTEKIYDTIQQRDPGAGISIDCQGGMDYDWPRMAKIVNTFTQSPLESFNNGTSRRMGTWIGYYVYARAEWDMRVVPWQYLFMGGTHVAWWPGAFSLTADLCEPLLCFKQAAEECRELESGAGKLLLESKKRIDPIVVLWSNSSYYAGIINPMETSWEQCRVRFEDMLRHVGLDFRMIDENASQKELAFGETQKVLILPGCQSLAGATIEKIKDFAKTGGLVIADYPPALMDEYLRPYDETANTGDIKFETCVKCKGEKRVEVGNVWQACPTCGGTGQTMKGGAALTKSALEDLFDLNIKGVKQYGKGCGFYLKGSPDKREQWCAIRQALITQAGIQPGTEVLDSVGNIRTDVRSYFFDNGRAVFLGLIPDKTISDPPGDMLYIKSAKKHHAYDVRRKQYLGETDRIETGIAAVEPRLFAFLPERIDGLSLNLNGKEFEPGETVELKCTMLPNSLKDSRFAVRIEVTKDGKPLEYFTKNIAVQGKAIYPIPLALNQEKGEYHVRATEVISGFTQEISFKVE